jgi:hypothetical protein
MGWCHEFGPQISEGCNHPMTAGEDSCYCEACGVGCHGQFGGCPDVWARGPVKIEFSAPPATTGRASRVAATEARAGTPTGPRPTPPVYVEAAAPMAAEPTSVSVGDSRLEVMEWLRGAFEGVRAELRVLSDGIARQQSSIADIAEANAAAAELVRVSDLLPQRVAAAVADAIAHAAPVTSPESEQALASVAEALVQLEHLADDLRSESLRLHAFREALAADLPTVARAVEEAAARADARLADLSDRVDELSARKGLAGLVRGLGTPRSA